MRNVPTFDCTIDVIGAAYLRHTFHRFAVPLPSEREATGLDMIGNRGGCFVSSRRLVQDPACRGRSGGGLYDVWAA